MRKSQEKIQLMFKDHPELLKLYVTSDGQGFTRRSAAESHAQVLVDKTVVRCLASDYRDGDREDVENILDKSIKDLEPVIAGVETLEGLSMLEAEEKRGQNRKGVFALIDERAEVLNEGIQAEDVVTEDKNKEDQ